jgi:predicted regulator of Ras-like GTPase activity (Roadblock/LC7/MglB family)
MLYLPSLESLLASVKGSQAALLLDSEGEVVVEAGDKQFRHRLIGAYEGIGLAEMRRIAARHQMGALDYILRRHAGGHVILRPLKDGYFLILSLGPDAAVSEGVHRSLETKADLDADL